MHARRTALARFIDTSALWALCLMAWLTWLTTRTGRLYAALPLSCACAMATISLTYLLRGVLRARRRPALTSAQANAICERIALMGRSEALQAIAAQLSTHGIYSDCAPAGGVIRAQKPADSRKPARMIALICRHPAQPAGADALITAWRACRSAAASDSTPRIVILSTAAYTSDATELARRLDVTLIAPAALAGLMQSALPQCDSGRAPSPWNAALRRVICRANAGRMGVYALGMGLMGRVLGLRWFTASGLICFALWLLCAAQPRPPRQDKWA